MNKEWVEKVKDFLLKGDESLINNIVKAILIGLIVGLIIGFTGEKWDFTVHYRQEFDFDIEHVEYFEFYGTKQAIISGILTTLLLFLKYNKK
jgi:xanthine/uracil permease